MPSHYSKKMSFQPNQEQFIQSRWLSEEKLQNYEQSPPKRARSHSPMGVPRVRKVCEIHELMKKNLSLHRSLDDKVNSFDLAHLSMDRSESQVQRLTQQLRDSQETLHVFKDSQDLKDPDPASCEVSRHNHVLIVKTAGGVFCLSSTVL